jgi:hypothetical protein
VYYLVFDVICRASAKHLAPDDEGISKGHSQCPAEEESSSNELKERTTSLIALLSGEPKHDDYDKMHKLLDQGVNIDGMTVTGVPIICLSLQQTSMMDFADPVSKLLIG